MATYLQDTFNRADAGSWGTASGGGAWSRLMAGSGYSWAITSNKGTLSGNWDGENDAYHSLSTHSVITITGVITTSGQFYESGGRAENIDIAVRHNGTQLRVDGGYGVRLSGYNIASYDNIQICDTTTIRAQGKYEFLNNTSHNVQIDINSQNHLFLYLWAVGGSKPGTPTLSWTNGGSSYTPAASGSNFLLGYLPNQITTGTVSFDDFLITNYAPFMPRPAKLPRQAPNRASTY